MTNGSIEPSGGLETYRLDTRRHVVIRSVTTKNGTTRESEIVAVGTAKDHKDLHSLFDSSWLKSTITPPTPPKSRRRIRIADLFSGSGTMTLGALEACRALEFLGLPTLAIDANAKATAVFEANFPSAHVTSEPIESVLDREIGHSTSARERRLRSVIGRTDLILGGPPCQGHSNLNNHTRRSDPKNALLLKMVRAAEVLEPDTVIIENVKAIQNDRGRVVDAAVERLRQLGYEVDYGTLEAEELGVAQTRHRFLLVATTKAGVRIDTIAERYRTPLRDFAWAAGDLNNVQCDEVFDTAPTPSAANRKRIDYLFRHNLFDLPNRQRPPCHRNNSHTYKSVYGRLHWDKPAQTITTGYGSMGQGRFVHPTQRRTITAREAARLQFIPDFFKFGSVGRGAVAEMIGNAVPPKLTYVAVLEVLR